MPHAVPRRTLVLAALALLVALWAAEAARADSIVYVKRDNVWLTDPDGAAPRPLTTDGTPTLPYSSPTMADDGTVVALRAKHFVRLRPDGTPLGEPVPGAGSTVDTSGNLILPTGPLDPVVSRDGRRIAYWFGSMVYHCQQWFNCTYRMQDNVAYSWAGRFTDWREMGLVRDYRDPSWIDDDRLLLFNFGFAPPVVVHRPPGGEDTLATFLRRGSGYEFTKGQIARSGDRLSILVGRNHGHTPQEELHLAFLPDGADGVVRDRCVLTNGGLFASATWSPDARRIVWADGDGIGVGEIPDLTSESVECTAITGRVLDPEGSQPFWGPAEPPPAPAANAGPRRTARSDVTARAATGGLPGAAHPPASSGSSARSAGGSDADR